MSERLYFDWNARAPLRPEARAAIGGALEVTGNAVLGACGRAGGAGA